VPHRHSGPTSTTARRPKRARGIGNTNNKGKDRGMFWAGMVMGAASATGGFFAVRALEKVFKKQPTENPSAVTEAQKRLVAQATGQSAPALPPALTGSSSKPPVVKRTVIEEMVEDLDS
jgi:hypothetical protein